MIGHDGKPSHNGIMSTDTRAWAQVERWYKDGTNKKVYEKTFQEILAVQPVSLLAWFRENQPEVLENTHLFFVGKAGSNAAGIYVEHARRYGCAFGKQGFLTCFFCYMAAEIGGMRFRENQPEVLENTKYIFAVKDYIRYMLTGEAYSEYTDCSGGNLVNMVTGEHDRELMALYGLEDCYEKLPPLRHSADLCGHVTKEASEKTLLPEALFSMAPRMASAFTCHSSSRSFSV